MGKQVMAGGETNSSRTAVRVGTFDFELFSPTVPLHLLLPLPGIVSPSFHRGGAVKCLLLREDVCLE